MASITVVSGRHCVSATLVLGSGHLVEANLVVKLSASIGIPHFIARMVESQLAHWEVRHDVLCVHHSVVLSTWVESHDVVGECLVTCARRPESIEVDFVGGVQLLFDVYCCEGCKSCT